MRYLIHKNHIKELAERQSYLYDIFHMYFLPGKPEGSYIPLFPLGTNEPDIMFITGHFNQVRDYLSSHLHQITKSKIVITSCLGELLERLLNIKYYTKKDIYIPKNYKALCPVRQGKIFGFDFEISDAELDFYNTKGDIMERIDFVYEKL